ncbi:MAG: xanthine dehydrogenase family protein molybdopterin-binding subunit [Bauldia sp.]
MNQRVPPKFGMGASVSRVEDGALIRGVGRFVDDFQPEGCLHAYVLRSAVAHAEISVSGLAAARAAAGVRLVWTSGDLKGIGTIPGSGFQAQPDGSRPKAPPRPLLAEGIVRHVGDPIAFVVADSIEQAKAAAETIAVRYVSRPVVTDAVAALAAGAPLVWPDRRSNRAFEYSIGDAAATEAAFAGAARVSRIRVVNNRVVTNYMETRGVVAEYAAEEQRWTLTLGSQGGHSIRDTIARDILKVPSEQIRVVTPDVGGGFGTKAFVYHEYPLAALAARATGRPVKWIGERSEHFLVDSQGRDNASTAEMAMDAEGRFLALRVEIVANMGAYISPFAGYIPYGGGTMSPGVYDIAAAHVRAFGVFTNTVPVDAYRGAGRPEAAYLIERLVDVCGRDSGFGPIEIRRRNFIPPEKMPYRTAMGRTYDSGEFAGHLDRALAVADHAGFAARARESAARGRVRGFGLSCYIEACAFPGEEPATLQLERDGSVTLLIGTQANGQGHATAYAQFVVGHLGIGYDRVTVIQGDTDRVPSGGGTGGSRSVPLGAVSADRAGAAMAEAIKAVAAKRLEAEPAELELVDGLVRVRGRNRSLSLAEVAAASPEPLVVVGSYRQKASTFPNGTHACELEIDPETGETIILRYVVVDDFGATVNPVMLEGQVQGGVVQGIGQALLERTVYDANGQLLTASFLDYAMPRAASLPGFHFETRNVPCLSNPFGIKGAGEAGSVGACAAVMNAVADALRRGFGIETVDMPATPARLWALVHGAAS